MRSKSTDSSSRNSSLQAECDAAVLLSVLRSQLRTYTYLHLHLCLSCTTGAVSYDTITRGGGFYWLILSLGLPHEDVKGAPRYHATIAPGGGRRVHVLGVGVL